MFSYLRLALRNQADKWLSSVVRHLQITPAQKTWTHVRPMFKTEFSAFSDDKLIIHGLAKLSHRPGENPRMFFHDWRSSFTSLRRTTPLTVSNQIDQLKRLPEATQRPHSQRQSTTTRTTLPTSCLPNWSRWPLQKTSIDSFPTRIKADWRWKMHTRLIFFDHRMEIDKKPNTLNAVNEESNNIQSNKQDVAAFRPQKKTRAFQPNSNRGNNRSRGQNNRSNYNNGNRQNYQNYNQSNQPKSNNSGNGKFCAYCQILNHSQEDCRKRIKDNKPCHKQWQIILA